MSNPRTVAIVFISSLHLLLFTRFFWLSDDGIIVFRVVRNFLEGNGLVYNIGERCQAFTSPLWTLYLTPFFAIFPTAGAAAFAAHLVALVLFLRVFLSNFYEVKSVLLAGVVLALSTSFVEYTSSGLENILVYYILTLMLTMSLNENFSWRFFVVLGLLFLARMDAILFAVYPLFKAFSKLGTVGFIKGSSITVAITATWLIFSTFYYGFPLPNTYYAKLHTGINSAEYIKQGIVYLVDFFIFDPVGAFLLIFAICILAVSRSGYLIGLALHVLYVIKIGGDFQSGRFFGSDVVYSALILGLAVSHLRSTHLASLTVVLVLVSLANKFSLFRFEQSWTDVFIRPSGIAPERAWYVERDRSFFSVRRDQPLFFDDPWFKNFRTRSVNVVETAGLEGYSQPGSHLVDVFALVDPLLSKLPSIPDDHWRIGHFARRLPLGYLKTLETGVNHIAEDSLREYYEQLRIATRGELFSKSRIQAILWLNSKAAAQRLLPVRGIKAQTTSCERVVFDPDRASRYRFADLIEVFQPGLELKCKFKPGGRITVYHRGPFRLSRAEGGDISCSYSGITRFGLHEADVSNCVNQSVSGEIKLRFTPVAGTFLFFGIKLGDEF